MRQDGEDRRKAANAFLIDIVKGKKYDLKNLELGVGSADILKAEILDASGNLKSGLSAVDLLTKATFKRSATDDVSTEQRAMRERQFEDFTAMEGLDSSECSDASRAVLTAEFSGTKAHILELRAALIEHAKGMTVIAGNGAGLVDTSWDTQLNPVSPSGDHLELTFGHRGRLFSGGGLFSRCQNCGTNTNCPCCQNGCQCANGCPCCQQQQPQQPVFQQQPQTQNVAMQPVQAAPLNFQAAAPFLGAFASMRTGII